MIKRGLRLIARTSFSKKGGKFLHGFESISGKIKIPMVSDFQVNLYSFFTKKTKNVEEFENKIEEKVEKSAEMQLNWNFEGSKKLLEEIVEECKAFYKTEKYPNRHLHLMRIAVCCMEMGDQEKAEKQLEQIIKDLDKNCSNEYDYQYLADAFSNLSVIKSIQGNLEKALEHERRAYQIIKENFSDEVHNLSLAISLSHIGEYQYLQSLIQEAIISYEESIRLMEDLFQMVKSEQDKNSLIPHLCIAYERLGGIHMDLRNRELCENYFKSAMGLHIQMKGENYPILAQFYTSFATLNIWYKEWDEALKNIKKGQSILDKAERTDPVINLEGNLNYVLAAYHNERGETEQALKYLNITENFMKSGKIKDVFTQNKVLLLKVGILNALGKYEEMEKLLEESLILNKKIYKDKENEFAFYSIYFNYSVLFLQHKKDFEKAIEYSWKAYNIAANIVGKDDEYCGDTLATIFYAYNLQKKWPEAIEYGNRAIEIMKKKPHKRSNAEALIHELAFIYNLLGDKKKCLFYLKECKNMLLEDLANASEESQAVIKMQIEDVDAKISKIEIDILTD